MQGVELKTASPAATAIMTLDKRKNRSHREKTNRAMTFSFRHAPRAPHHLVSISLQQTQPFVCRYKPEFLRNEPNFINRALRDQHLSRRSRRSTPLNPHYACPKTTVLAGYRKTNGAFFPAVCGDPIHRAQTGSGRPGAKASLHID
jgi:hypothetical protein